MANGYLHDNLVELGQNGNYAQSDLMFHQAVDGSSTEIAQSLGDLGQPVISRGAAVADYDLDGD